MKVTLKEVAVRAGVSRSAVSRTFTKGASVSARTREKVERAAAELGYRPNILASSLSTGRTKLIGMVSDNFQNPYFLEIFDRFTRHLQKAGLRPLLVNLAVDDDAEQALQMLRQYSVDGVIVASSTLPAAFVAAFEDGGLPSVNAFGQSSGSPRMDLVSLDNLDAGRLAARTLAERGYRRVGFLGGPAAAATTTDRLNGFVAGCAAEGLELAENTFAQGYSFDAGRAAMAGAFDRLHRLDALFCGDDIIAIGALSVLKDRGRSVPGDIGILGLNDIEMARWPNIDLTTIRQPVEEIAAQTVALIAERIARPGGPVRTVLLEPRLVERGTLAPLPG